MIQNQLLQARGDVSYQLELMWDMIKAPLIVPLLKLGVIVCLTMSLMLFMERLYMGIVISLVKMFWKKPDKRYNWEALPDSIDDIETGGSNKFPHVLIQIPMFNEREVISFSMLFFSFLFGLLETSLFLPKVTKSFIHLAFLGLLSFVFLVIFLPLIGIVIRDRISFKSLYLIT